MKQYKITKHAIDRAIERLGCPSESDAVNRLNQLAQSAFYVGDIPHERGGRVRVCDHVKKRVRLIISHSDEIITVYPFDEVAGAVKANSRTPLSDKVTSFVSKELRKAETQFKRLSRRAEIEMAELGMELAQLALNKAKAKSPKVKAAIADRIRDKNALLSEISERVEREADQFNKLKKGAEMYGAGDVE